MSVKQLKPIVIKPERVVTPQCSAEPEEQERLKHWRQDRYKQLRPHMNPLRCQRESVVELGGKPYCRLHAGVLALDWWLKGKLVEADQ